MTGLPVVVSALSVGFAVWLCLRFVAQRDAARREAVQAHLRAIRYREVD